ncbi:gluconokinase [Thermoanaerobacter sp. RKWS2]|uniref:gluconokinase n=1 Tax=Thermoanaerobacter sp. RKWS2 TaxID=2983842 RepID=UPI00224AFC29|nr:gluconokinase [Thermoanaerobacter sp. RKWS2]UZQ83322.1 gluconokinase [Thermoanaerobacter sp. RKWS2]
MGEYYLGVDIGTTGVRSIVFDSEGKLIASDYKEYPMICLEKGMAELDPNIVFQSFTEVVRNSILKSKISNKEIRAIGLSAQMHSILALDKEGNNLTNVITWADTRAMEESQYIAENYDFYDLYRKTGCIVKHPMYPLSKIIWLKNNRPEIYKKTYKFITIKEYIVYRLSDEFFIDIADASATGCLNIHSLTWDQEILADILKANSDILFGDIVDPGFILPSIENKFIEELGISKNTSLIIGASDGITAHIGCGCFDNEKVSCTVGTSGALRVITDKPILDKDAQTWCYCFNNSKWIIGGAISNGGIVLKYLRDQFREQFEYELSKTKYENIYKLFDEYATQINPGSDGLIFLPFLAGERAPGWNPKASAALFGMKLMHTKKHIIRAMMEGVMYNMYSVYKIIEKINGGAKKIIANGGYVNSDEWLQIQADIFNKEIAVMKINEATALGAAYIAMSSVGDIELFKDYLPVMNYSRIVKPNNENVNKYNKIYKVYKEYYEFVEKNFN